MQPPDEADVNANEQLELIALRAFFSGSSPNAFSQMLVLLRRHLDQGNTKEFSRLAHIVVEMCHKIDVEDDVPF